MRLTRYAFAEHALAELPDARLLGLSDHGDLLSFTIITTAPRGVMRGLHDRMPLILAPEHYDRWLDPRELSPEETDPLLAPDDFVAYPVSSFVNRPQNDGPACVQPVGRMIE